MTASSSSDPPAIADVSASITVQLVGGPTALGGVTCELPLWRSHVLSRPDGGELRITGVPAQHGPAGTEHLTGEVRGFVLSGVGLPTVYVSGANASLAVVRRSDVLIASEPVREHDGRPVLPAGHHHVVPAQHVHAGILPPSPPPDLRTDPPSSG